jgi:hypothetical protein
MTKPSSVTAGIFGRAWQLLRRNWTIVVPGLVVGLLSGVVSELIVPSKSDFGDGPLASLPASVASALAVNVVALVAALLSIAYTTGMANAAWEHGTAHFADGRRALQRDTGRILVAMLGLAAIGIVAALVAPYTAFLSLAIYAFFCLYTMPSAVVGERGGFGAIAESVRLASTYALPTLFTILVIFAVGVVMGTLAAFIDSVPFLGHVLSAIVLQVVVAYVTLVVVGLYRIERSL